MVRQGEVHHRHHVGFSSPGAMTVKFGNSRIYGDVERSRGASGRPEPVRPARSRAQTTGQVLQRDLLEDLVEGALEERAVDVHDGPGIPALAIPAAKATAWLSQMPTSKNWSGNVSRTFWSLFPSHIAAVRTATCGSRLHRGVDTGPSGDGVGVALRPSRWSAG